GDGETLASLSFKFSFKAGISGAEIQLIIIAPDFIRPLSYQTLQFWKTAFLAEPDIIHAGQAVEIHKFIINPVFLLIGTGRNNPYNISGNGYCPEKLQDTDPFIAFLNIEFIHILIGLDGITDSFGQMRLVD